MYRLTPHATTYPTFTAVTRAHMLCPSMIITREPPVITSKATIQQLIKEMQSIRFYDHAADKCHSGQKPYVPYDLLFCSKVWVRVDRVKKSLEVPY